MNIYKALIFNYGSCKECLINGFDIHDAITKLPSHGYNYDSILKIRLVSSNDSEDLTEQTF